jgi:hypothetical protein
MKDEAKKIVARFKQLLKDTKYEDKSDMLSKVLELAFEESLFGDEE